MYLEFYGLSEKPFSQTPDPRFLYWNDAYRETLASLSYGIRERKGFIAMLGEAGTGKTTLLRKLLDDLREDIVSVFLFNPNATFEEILEYTLSELGISATSGRKLSMLQRLNEFLLAAYGEGRNTILLIDEAQDLDSEVLESLRLLSNLETSDDKILQIVLSGQPELAQKLAEPGLRQLKQRIAVRCRLEPLTFDELPNYLGTRLEVVGGSPELFSGDTFEPIWEFTSGIPRLINTLCDNALLLGYALGKRTIDGGIIREVVQDLRAIDADMWGPPTAERATPAAIPAPLPSPTTTPATPTPPVPAPSAPRGFDLQTSPARRQAAPGTGRAPKNFASALSDLSPAWVTSGLLAAILLVILGVWLGGPSTDSGETRATPSDSVENVAGPAPEAVASAKDAQETSTAPPDQSAASENRPAPDETSAAVQDLVRARPNVESSSRRGLSGSEAPKAEAIQRVSDTAETKPAAPEAPTTAPRTGREVEGELSPGTVDQPSTNEQESTDLTTNPPAGLRVAAATSGIPPRDRRPTTPVGEVALPVRAVPPTSDLNTLQTAREGSPNPPVSRRSAEFSSENGAQEIAVAPGDTLAEMAEKRYGTSNTTTLDMLTAANPEISSIDWIIAGSGVRFPDPGPESRILPDGTGYAVLAMTTPALSRALSLQSFLEDKFTRPVSLERVSTRSGQSLFRVSIRGLTDRADAAEIASGLGPILKDPSP